MRTCHVQLMVNTCPAPVDKIASATLHAARAVQHHPVLCTLKSTYAPTCHVVLMVGTCHPAPCAMRTHIMLCPYLPGAADGGHLPFVDDLAVRLCKGCKPATGNVLPVEHLRLSSCQNVVCQAVQTLKASKMGAYRWVVHIRGCR